MSEKFLLTVKFLALGCALLFAAAGCSDAPDEGRAAGGGYEGESLAYSVYAGEDAAGSWATFAFTKDDEGKDTVYYFPDNAACYYGGYVYAAGSGAITEVTRASDHGVPGPAPGTFTISADGKAVTFTAYTGVGGEPAESSFPRRRGMGGDRSADDQPPQDLPALSAGQSLDGTVWAATAYRTRDWTTLAVTGEAGTTAAGTITVSHSFDCTSFPRAYGNYAYNTESTLAYIGPFRVSGNTFTFLNFYGHNAEITLRRLK